MERMTLNIKEREKTGKGAARTLRRSGVLPGIVYRGGKSTPVQIDKRELSQFISRTAGEQVIAHLNIAGEMKQAIIKDYHVDPVTGTLLHVDFQEVLATEEIRVMVHVITSGEPVGVKRDGGILQYGIREIEIECLPDKIPGHIQVDVSQLGIAQSIHVGDLKLAEGIRVLTDADDVIATVTAVREEVAAPEAEAAPEVVEPEVIKKGKKPAEEEEK